jgi:gamma-glutamyl hercynylcysteine S-oxide synthase
LSLRSAALDDPLAWRSAGRELLALALMDARNTLLAQLADAQADPGPGAARGAAPKAATGGPAEPSLGRLALMAGAWQEHWIIGNPQRGRGEAADAERPRLGGIEPRLTAWLRGAEEPSADELCAYLAASLEHTLDLLARAAEDDTGLFLFRQALRHEDRLAEALAVTRRETAPPARPERTALWVPASRWRLPAPTGTGFVPETERGHLELALPEFEIDAQPVSWARFVEFADDGGYDRDELWSEAGRAWRDQAARRAPAFVEQLRGGVVLQRGLGARARLERAPMNQPAQHLSRHEAEAWCRWAGRRLPSEPEWAQAAGTLTRQGWAWGDVHEWVAGRARAWPEAGAWPTAALEQPDEAFGVLRAATWATPARARWAAARRFVAPSQDALAAGFRSCAC